MICYGYVMIKLLHDWFPNYLPVCHCRSFIFEWWVSFSRRAPFKWWASFSRRAPTGAIMWVSNAHSNHLWYVLPFNHLWCTTNGIVHITNDYYCILFRDYAHPHFWEKVSALANLPWEYAHQKVMHLFCQWEQKMFSSLLIIAQTIVLCGRQNLALRDHRDSGTDACRRCTVGKHKPWQL